MAAGTGNEDARAPAAEVPYWLRVVTAYTWRLLLVAAGAIAVVTLLSKIWVVFLAFVVAVLVSTVAVPAVAWLSGRGLPATLATWLVFLLGVAAVVAVFSFVGPRIVGEFSDVGGVGQDAVARVERWLTDGPLSLSERQVQRAGDRLVDAVRNRRGKIVAGVLGGANLALELMSVALLALVLAFFFTKDGRRLFEGSLSLLLRDGERASAVREAAERSWTALRGFLIGSTLDGLVEAALKATLLLVLGVPLVVPLAILTFLGGFLPFVGAIAAGLVSASVALVAKGPIVAAVVLAGSVVIQNVEGYLLQPLIMGRAVRTHPAIILIVVSSMGLLWGLIGAFLAVPAVTVARTIVEYARERRAG